MDDLFYRKDRKKVDIRAMLKKLARNKRAVLGFVIGIPLALFLFFGSHGIVQRIRLQNQKSDLEAKTLQADAETKKLQAESKALDGDRKAIEKVAREKHGMIREGETVYKVRKKN
ncbi:MAG: Septum formation initiator [Bacteroidetes bacterium]|nr:Septum formation initiator [Bacteroidota bacterium]